MFLEKSAVKVGKLVRDESHWKVLLEKGAPKVGKHVGDERSIDNDNNVSKLLQIRLLVFLLFHINSYKRRLNVAFAKPFRNTC